jgi:D-3-phosphoglycerate dehydrogenase
VVDATRALVNSARIRLMRPGGVILNFARAGIVDESAVLAALESAHSQHTCVIFLGSDQGSPAGRGPAPSGCLDRRSGGQLRVMAAETLRDFLENGNIRNSVNFQRPSWQRRAAAGSGSQTKMCRTWWARSLPASRPRNSTSPIC